MTRNTEIATARRKYLHCLQEIRENIPMIRQAEETAEIIGDDHSKDESGLLLHTSRGYINEHLHPEWPNADQEQIDNVLLVLPMEEGYSSYGEKSFGAVVFNKDGAMYFIGDGQTPDKRIQQEIPNLVLMLKLPGVFDMWTNAQGHNVYFGYMNNVPDCRKRLQEIESVVGDIGKLKETLKEVQQGKAVAAENKKERNSGEER